MDLLRGIAVGFIAMAAYADVLEVWMVFVGGVIIGLYGAFFNPVVSYAIPDIVHRSKIVRANYVFGMVLSRRIRCFVSFDPDSDTSWI